MEILYKAKRKYTGEWVEGFPFLCEQGKVHEIYYWESVLICEETNTHEAQMVSVQVIPETVCRHIGIEDKNGNKLFEHDTCLDLQGIEYEIRYSDYCSFMLYPKDDQDQFMAMYPGIVLEITGNIHDKKD